MPTQRARNVPPKWRQAICPTCGSNQGPRVVDGAWLKAQRERVRVTQRQLAVALGVSAAWICQVEGNRGTCPPRFLKVYENFAKEPSRLFGRK